MAGSTDFLLGLADDPTPAHDLARGRAGSVDDGDYVAVYELAAASGGGAVVVDERIIGRFKFRREWLAARDCRVIRVLGESMEPTLADGCSIIVNRAKPTMAHGPDLRGPHGRRTRRQARRSGRGGRLAARQRQPGQAGMADAALALRCPGDRRGQVGGATFS